jgi:hypothetical protein
MLRFDGQDNGGASQFVKKSTAPSKSTRQMITFTILRRQYGGRK